MDIVVRNTVRGAPRGAALARIFTCVGLLGALAAGPALATDPPHGAEVPHGAAPTHGSGAPYGAVPTHADGEGTHADGEGLGHGEAAADAHGEAAGHGGGAGEHHACYSCDDDHDGVGNWRDADAGEQYVLTNVGLHALNLALLFGVLAWGAGPALRDGARQRALLIQRDLKDAAAVRAEALARHEQVKARIAALEGEISEMRARAEVEAKAEEARIVERAKEAAVRLSETTRRQIHDEATRAKQALRREAVEIAVELAEGILKKQVQAGDQRRLAQEFLDAVQSEGVTHG